MAAGGFTKMSALQCVGCPDDTNGVNAMTYCDRNNDWWEYQGGSGENNNYGGEWVNTFKPCRKGYGEGLSKARGGKLAKGGRVTTNNKSRFSGRTQNNPKGKFKK